MKVIQLVWNDFLSWHFGQPSTQNNIPVRVKEDTDMATIVAKFKHSILSTRVAFPRENPDGTE